MNPDQPVTELFTQPGCQPCKAVEQKLVQYGIPYVVHDISTDENARERVRALGYTQTPDRKSTRLNSSHELKPRMPSSA